MGFNGRMIDNVVTLRIPNVETYLRNKLNIRYCVIIFSKMANIESC